MTRRPTTEPPRRRAVAIAGVLLACLAVVAFLPGGFSRWTLPKYVIAAAAVAVALFGTRTGRLPRWAWVIAAASLGVLLLAALISGDLVGLWGRWPRYQGPLVTLPIAVGMAWLGAVLLGPAADPRVRRWFFIGLSGAAILIGVVAGLETVGLRLIPSDLERPGSLLGNASDQAVVGLMIAAVLFSMVLARSTQAAWERRVTVAGLATAALAVVLAASRAGYLGLAVAVACVLVLTAVARHRANVAPTVTWPQWAWTGVVLGGAGIALLANPESVRRLFVGSGFSGGRGDRLLIWSETAELIGDAPWLGRGSGSFLDAIPELHRVEWYAVNGATVLESPHSWVLEVLVDGGAAFLGVVAVGLALSARVAWRQLAGVEPSAAAAVGSVGALAGALVALLTYFPNAGSLVLGALMLGSLIGEPLAALPKMHRRSRGAPPPRSQWVVRAGVIAWTAWLALSSLAEFPLGRGVAAAARADAKAADAAFSAALALRPWDPDTASIAAQSLAQAAQGGDPAVVVVGIDWGARAAARLPRSVSAHEAWAASLEAAGRYAEAALPRGVVTQVAPNDAAARLQLAITLALGGQDERALEQVDRALDLDPSLEAAEELRLRVCDRTPHHSCAQ